MATGLITPVILSGGSGTRLWPMSRRDYPKQFLPLDGDNTMLQATAMRAGVAGPVCARSRRLQRGPPLHGGRTAASAQGHPTQGIILEPLGRNTAPALTAAALWLLDREPGRDHAGAAIRSRGQGCARLSRRRADGRCRGTGRQSGHLRHSSPRAGNRLWLHRGRGRNRGRSTVVRRVDGFVEKARPRHRRRLRGGRQPFLEQRHVRLSAPTPWSAEIERFAPDVAVAARKALSATAPKISISSGLTVTPSPKRPPSPSITR